MQALSRLPVFFSLAGKRVVVAGGNAAAAWKVELLAAAGAAVEVFAPAAVRRIAAKLRAIRRRVRSRFSRANGTRPCSTAARLRSAPSMTRAKPRAFSQPRALAGVPCNVIDKPDFCDFSFGAIVNRSPMVVAISTDGAAPVFAQAVRSRIEAMLPAGFAALGAGRAQLARRA